MRYKWKSIKNVIRIIILSCNVNSIKLLLYDTQVLFHLPLKTKTLSKQLKFQLVCMEKLSFESVFLLKEFIYTSEAVDTVADDGMSGVSHMHAYLMCSSGEKAYIQQWVALSSKLKHISNGIVRFGVFWIDRIFGRHALAMMSISTDVGGDLSRFFPHSSTDERDIGLFDLLILEHSLKLLHGCVIFRDHEESAGFFIQTMHDTWSLHSIDDGKIFEVMEKPIDERPCRSSLTRDGMHIDKWVFVDDREVVVLKDDIQIHLFGLDSELLSREKHMNLILYLHDITLLGLFSIQ